jgi:hypothetical protein
MSVTKVYEPELRALLGTASHLCEAVVPMLPLRSAADQSRVRARKWGEAWSTRMARYSCDSQNLECGGLEQVPTVSKLFGVDPGCSVKGLRAWELVARVPHFVRQVSGLDFRSQIWGFGFRV